MKRVLFSVMLLVGVLLMGRTVFAGDGTSDAPVNLRISISPVLGDPGTVVTVSGTGANPAFDIVITLAPQADSADGALATTTITPNADGTFESTFTIPKDTTAGHYAIRAEQFTAAGNTIQYYWNGFTVGAVANAALLPETGAIPGTSLTVTAMLALLLAGGMVLRGVYAVVSANRMA